MFTNVSNLPCNHGLAAAAPWRGRGSINKRVTICATSNEDPPRTRRLEAELRYCGRPLNSPKGSRSRMQVQFRKHSLVAARADAVGELRIGVTADVTFHLLPVVRIGPDALAVAADRQE